MNNSKLIQLIKTFGTRERNQFRYYLQSHYFNRNQVLTHLYDTIDVLLFELKNDSFSKEYLWEQIFPDEPFDDVKIRLLCSELLKHAEQFITYRHFDKQSCIKSITLLEALNERGLDKHFNYIFNLANRQLAKNQKRDVDYYLQKFLMEIELNRYYSRQFLRTKQTNLPAALHALDLFYIVSKLKFCCEIINYKNIIDIDVDIHFIEEVIEHVSQRNYENDPAITIYFNILMMLREDDIKAYQQLKQQLGKWKHAFTKDELWGMYAYAINFCIRKINSGETDFLYDLFNLYKTALEEELLYENGRLSPWNYKNLRAVGLRVGEYEWTLKFIKQYKNKLAPEFRENAYTYNLASYYFAIRDYDKVLEMLHRVEYEDVFYNLDSKTMLLEVYYELEEWEALFSLLDSFQTYLRRNKLISDYHRTNYMNLIKFVRRLANTAPYDYDKLLKLKEEIQQTKHVIDINWLLSKIEERLPASKQHHSES